MTSEFISNGAFVVLLVNVTGTAVAGFFAYRGSSNDPLVPSRRNSFWITGFAGGLTTFSSFSFFVTDLSPFSAVIFAGLNLFLSMVLLMVIKPSLDSEKKNWST
jgi:CrcB protein